MKKNIPDIEKLLDWLKNPPVRTETGEMYSWVNPEHPGFIYDESASYVADLFTSIYANTGEKEYLDLSIETIEAVTLKIDPASGIGMNHVIANHGQKTSQQKSLIVLPHRLQT